MKNDPKIYVVIANYNSGKWLEKCYGSIFESDIEVKVVVVDNHSEDRSPDIIKESFPQIELIRSDVNLGFAKANNIGIRKALKEGANYVFLLNQDAWIESHTIRRLTEVSAQNPSYGILSPIHLNGSGELLDWNFSKYISQPFDDGRQLYTDLLLDRPLKTIYDVKYVNAAAWLISRKCIEQAGLFEDNLILQNGEDTNYLARVFYHKLKVGMF